MPSLTIQQAMDLAARYQEQGKFKEAEGICRQVLAGAPGHLPAMNRLGSVLALAGRGAEAVQVFRDVLEADRGSAPAWFNLALAHERVGQLDQAIAAQRRAIALCGEVAEYWHRLGTCLGQKRDLPAALEALHRAMEIDPRSRGIRHDLVFGLSAAGQVELAAQIARQGGAMEPDNTQALLEMVDNLRIAGRLDEAAEVCQRLVQTHPDDPEPHGHWALCLLALGDLARGWREYEWRWQCKSFTANVHRPLERQWGTALGAGWPELAGRTLLLYAEQGNGDTIQFIRYAALLAQRGARVIVECPWALKLLLQTCPGVRLVYTVHDLLPKYDWHIPVMSLPLALETTLETIPAQVPYVSTDAARAKSWRRRVERATGGKPALRVGLSWAGRPSHRNDANRSMDPALLSPLAQVPGVTFFSLQKTSQNQKAASPPPGLPLLDFTLGLHDFSDTAAFIEQLDLVISVDTAVAHLAGAMAKPVWLLLPFMADFRWMLDRPDSPWYPTMRIFRQAVLGDWPPVIACVAAALQQMKKPEIRNQNDESNQNGE